MVLNAAHFLTENYVKLQFEVYNKHGAMFAIFLTGADALTQAKSYKPGFIADGCRVVVRRLN
jgi:hypothetical protein